jgi:hypothetical protein
MQDFPATEMAQLHLMDQISGRDARKGAGSGHQVGSRLVREGKCKRKPMMLGIDEGRVGEGMVLAIELFGSE